MTELSLHVLDVAENSTKAGASLVTISVDIQSTEDKIIISIIDDGCGMTAEQVAKVTGTNKDASAAKEPVRRTARKVMPNEPCPCGSGKKYKHCCGKN